MAETGWASSTRSVFFAHDCRCLEHQFLTPERHKDSKIHAANDIEKDTVINATIVTLDVLILHGC